MKGIYAITDCDGRVYYVGQSKDLESRAKQHLREIKKDRNDYDKNKMYWILGIMYECCYHTLNFQVLDIDENWTEEDLLEIEADTTRELKPVLNTQVPKDCIRYIDNIWSVTDAIVQAEENGRWDFGELPKLWSDV